MQTEIFVDERFDGIAVVIGNDGQGRRASALNRGLPRFAMHPLVSHFREPLPGLAIHIMQVRELSQGPERLACIPDGALDLSFFPPADGLQAFG